MCAVIMCGQMAEAGFYHTPTDCEPDLVRCFVCGKELDGWEPTDDPWYDGQELGLGSHPFIHPSKELDGWEPTDDPWSAELQNTNLSLN